MRDSGYSESQSEDATANQPANPEPRLNQVLRVRHAPPVSNQRAGYFGRTFQNSENKTNRGTFKGRDASRSAVSFRPRNGSLIFARLPSPPWKEAEIQIPLPTPEPGSARRRGTEAASRGWARRLGAGTLLPAPLRSAREDPSARSHAPRPLGASPTENKNKGFARLRRLRRSREDAEVRGGRCAPLRSRMRPGL